MRKSYLSYLKTKLYWEPSFILKYYLHKKNCIERDEYIFMADGKMIHGGLFDRLKGAISIYALSKVHGKPFGLYFTDPFCLEKYLEPNQYDWKKSENDLNYAYPYSRPVIAYSELHYPKRLMKAREGQIHFYFGGDILENINKKYKRNFDWAVLFNELFVPSRSLASYIEKIKENIGCRYIAIHIRFLNLLGDKNENKTYKALDQKGRDLLIQTCINKIKELTVSYNSNHIVPVLCSDSKAFLGFLKNELPNVFIIKGTPCHIDKISELSEDDALKLFADMYILAGAQKVYSIVGCGLYKSAFPQYSAKIGRTKFERISLL